MYVVCACELYLCKCVCVFCMRAEMFCLLLFNVLLSVVPVRVKVSRCAPVVLRRGRAKLAVQRRFVM